MAEATQRSRIEESAEGKQVIVQCPACQTKFLVGTTALHGVDFPRFHCSRCDHLFSLDSNALGVGEATPTTAPSQSELFVPPFSEATDRGGDVATLGEEDPLPSVSVAPSPTPLIDDFAPIPGSAVDTLAFDPTPAPTPLPRTSTITRGIEIPKRLDSAAKPVSPLAHHTGLDEEQQIAFDFVASSTPEDRLFDSGDIALETRSAPPTQPMLPTGLPWRTGGWRGVAAVGLPVLGCLTILALLAFSLGSNRRFDQQVITTLFPNAAEIAPADVRVVDTSFEPIALSNGETVHLITGTVINDSGADIANVVLEGLTFDAAGRVLSSAKVTSGATLAHSRLQSLTPDIIVKLQAGENSKPLRLRAGDSERVSLALTDHAVREARFFAARVYSVKRTE